MTRDRLSPGRYGLVALALLLLVYQAWLKPTNSEAIDGIYVSLEDFEGAGLSMERLDVELEWQGSSAARIRLNLTKPRFTDPNTPVPDWLRRLKEVRLDCQKAQLDREQFQCRQGKVHLPLPWLDKPEFRINLRYGFASGKLNVDLQGLALAGGRGAISLSADLDGKQPWQARYRLDKAEVALLPALISHFAELNLPLELTDGQLAASGRVRGTRFLGDVVLGSVSYDIYLSSLAGGNDAGTLAMDALESHWVGTLTPGPEPRFNTEVEIKTGEFYAEPMYLDFNQGPVQLHAVGSLGKQGLALSAFEFNDPDSLEANGSLFIRQKGGLQELDLKTLSIKLDKAYPRYFQPLLAETSLEDLEIGGELSGSLGIKEGGLEDLDLRLTRGNLDDRKQRFGLYEAQGQLRWNAKETRQSSLKVLGGYLLAMDLGAFEWHGHSQGDRFQLQTPAQLPLLDGRLQIDAFQFHGGEQPEAVFEALMTPISMERVAHAFNWPAMEGQLSGVIPRISMKNGRLDMDGTLLVRAFGGQLTLRNLVIQDPLGAAPRLDADIRLKDLDLETLTRTFSFGRIEGRLGGEVENLSLVNWQPVSFDARFATPEDDDSRHRISQRAVDNLTSLGGGIGGALSQSFLRFFEEFSYDRLGLSCHLRGTVCEMDGVQQAKNGYYIVKGSGLPQINVIGYSRRVDWPTMVGRLKRITQQGGPVIQ